MHKAAPKDIVLKGGLWFLRECCEKNSFVVENVNFTLVEKYIFYAC